MNENIEAKNKVAKCAFTFWKDKKVDFTSALNMPIVYNPVLDETLDTATILLTDLKAKDYPTVDVTTAFEIGTIVEVTFEGQQTAIKMIISHDDCKMQRKSESRYKSYRHTIQLVEFTKELERLSVDTLTFTNPIPRIYDAEADANWTAV